jgi:putative transposase
VWLAIREVLLEAASQCSYVHFTYIRNALDHLPRKHADDCLQELRWLYDRKDLNEAKTDLAAGLSKWSARYPKLTDSVEELSKETFTTCCTAGIIRT